MQIVHNLENSHRNSNLDSVEISTVICDVRGDALTHQGFVVHVRLISCRAKQNGYIPRGSSPDLSGLAVVKLAADYLTDYICNMHSLRLCF